jgi:steroid 22-alpha-hydroxylase
MVGIELVELSFVEPIAQHWLVIALCRFGDMFKSRLMGSLCIIPTKGETIKWILNHDGKQFVTGYPKTFRKVLGEYTALSSHGEKWKSTRRFLVNSLRNEQVRARLPAIETLVLECLKSWDTQESVSIREETKSVSANFISKLY